MRTRHFLVLAVLLVSAHARAQPALPDVEKPSMNSGGNSGVKIPISLPDSPEVLGIDTPAPTTPALPLDRPVDPNTYICGPGDNFDIVFWGKQNFRVPVTTNLEGNAFISKIGFVKVSGQSLTAVRATVTKLVKRALPGLSFEMVLTRPRSFVVHIADNVKNSGGYTSSALERVSTLISHAGGSTGSRRKIEVHRASGEVLIADLQMYELTGDTKFNPFVLDGDVIRVPFAETTVTISGAVRRPGVYELVGTKDLVELLSLAGGLKTSASLDEPIRVVRRNAQHHATYTDLPFKGSQPTNAALEDDDEVLVRSVVELQQSIVLLGAVAGAETADGPSAVRRMPYIEGDTVRSVLERAGGVQTVGDLRRSYITRPRSKEDPLVIPVDLEALLIKRDFSKDVPLFMGDTITVPPFKYGVIVDGAVSHPGAYFYGPQFTIAQYIARAGGRTRTARDMSDVKVIDLDGKTKPYKADGALAPGDSIFVPERNFSRAEVAQLTIAAAGIILSGVAIAIAASR